MPRQFLLANVLMRDGLHNVWTRYKHIRRVADHEDKIRDRWRVHRTASAWPHDHGNLWNHAAGKDVLLKHVGITAQACNALLNPGATTIGQADHGRTDLHRLLHDLTDFLGMRFGKGSAKNGEVLTVNKGTATIDGAVSGDNAITGNPVVFHPKVCCAVFNEHVQLFE